MSVASHYITVFERGPRARVVEIAGCGHAPALNVLGQSGLVEEFLAA